MATVIGKIRKIEKNKAAKELTKNEIQAKLKELGIEYAQNATKEILISLLPKE